MRILYDGFIYRYQVAGGINRYFANIIRRLPENWTPAIAIDQWHPLQTPTHPNLRLLSYTRRRPFPPSRLFYWLDKYYFNPFRRATHPDVLHPMYYALLNHQELCNYRCPIVLTVYDMINEKFPNLSYQVDDIVEKKRRAIRVAQKIICISEHTKQDVLAHYALPEQQVTVIYPAAELDVNCISDSDPVPDRPYYLYVGSRPQYKNFDGLLQAFANVHALRPEMMLCVVGPPLTNDEQTAIAALKLSDQVVAYGQVSDGHLARLYNKSLALVYPSLCEGFGIPLLEAMACGTAVVAANTSSIPEVVGDAGLLFDPQVTDELVDRLLFLLDYPGERERLIAQGFQRVKCFSWEEAASQTMNVYREVCPHGES